MLRSILQGVVILAYTAVVALMVLILSAKFTISVANEAGEQGRVQMVKYVDQTADEMAKELSDFLQQNNRAIKSYIDARCKQQCCDCCDELKQKIEEGKCKCPPPPAACDCGCGCPPGQCTCEDCPCSKAGKAGKKKP